MRTAEDVVTNDFVSIGSNEPASQLIGRLKDEDVSHACIIDNAHFVGLFSPHELMKARVDIAKLKMARLAMPAPQLQPKDDLLAIASYMYDSNASILPVIKGEKVVGIVEVLEVLKYLKELPQFKELKVRDIRHPTPITVHEEDRIDTALSIMHDEHIDRLPVVDDLGRMSGFVSYKDVLEKYYAHHITGDAKERHMRPVTKTKAFEANRPEVPGLAVMNIMNKNEVVTIDEHESVSTAVQKMITNNVLSLMILDDRRPTGIVTKRDILEAVVHAQIPENKNIQYVGLDELDIDTYQSIHLRRIVSRHAADIQKYFKNEFQLVVHIKEYSKTGSRHKFSVHLRATHPGATVPATQGHGWNVRTAVQESFKRLASHLAKKYKGPTKRPSIRKSPI